MAEGRAYKGRVCLSEELERGNVSLQLRESRESDIGHYLCRVTDGERTAWLTVRLWWHPLRSLRRLFHCGVIPNVIMQQWGRKWTEEEKMRMEESSLLTEHNMDVKTIIKELLKTHAALEKTEQQLKNTKLDLERATRELEDGTDLYLSGSVPKLYPPIMGGASSSSDSSHLRLVLLGKTGSGKSAAVSTILGGEEENQDLTLNATSTQKSESIQVEVAGRMVTVVDTPDWFSPGLPLEKLKQDMECCVRFSAPGPHAFLLVIPVKQPTGEERGMLEKMEEIFGNECWETTFILFTVTDELQKSNVEEFIQSGDQEVRRLVEKCGNKFHCLNIKKSGDSSQVSELLEKIEKMVEGSRKKFYSIEIYLETQSEIEKIIMLLKEKKIAKEVKEMEVKLEQEVTGSLKKIKGMIQEHEKDITQLNSQIAELERKTKEEMDESKRDKLEKELEGEMQKRTKIENIIVILNEKIEWERKEMDEKLKREVEEIRKAYEGETGMEAERNLIKIMHPEIQRYISIYSKSMMEEDFREKMEEKDRELEILKQTLTALREETKESMMGKEAQESSGEIVSLNKFRKRCGSI
ncbi:uncharacterized protein Hap1MRO34_025593 isoform 1-T1 [Clarias gariepinus]|uniref:uncharacterized protein LOC128512214 n=1 Tax=Clarias gariepinus TaxID=13013 RepID=UPI00234D271E|nr:uncharacterized protein LOC128512214 [Clarias gariepinus]